MSFNIEAVLEDMLDAIKESTESDWNEIEGYLKEILENEKEVFKTLAEQRIRGEITEEELKSELEDEEDTLKAEFKALEVMTLAATQRAVNAAIDIFVKAVKEAI